MYESCFDSASRTFAVRMKHLGGIEEIHLMSVECVVLVYCTVVGTIRWVSCMCIHPVLHYQSRLSYIDIITSRAVDDID